ALPHSRLERALDDRYCGVVRLHPHAQRGCHRPLRAGSGRDQGRGDLRLVDRTACATAVTALRYVEGRPSPGGIANEGNSTGVPRPSDHSSLNAARTWPFTALRVAFAAASL